jgi:formylmethanofuran dehydrogenase subunit C
VTTLTLREAPSAPVEAVALAPDRLAALPPDEVPRLELHHGSERVALGDLFTVGDAGGTELRLEGDLRRLAGLGTGMAAGRLVAAGSVGPRAGAEMTGGELVVEGDAGDWAGAQMRGGVLTIRGSAGAQLGGAWPGESAGMRGGEIVVGGDAGPEAAAGLRRGTVAVAGTVGPGAALRMRAGTLVALGGLGPEAGAALRRGTLVSMASADLLPTYAYACTYRPPFLALLLARLRALGLPVTAAQEAGPYARFCGDGAELDRGEILILEDAP